MKEYYIERTESLHEGHGEVWIEFKDWEGEMISLCYNASELLRDLPHLYDIAKRAYAREQEHIDQKYRELSKKIYNDVKKPVGRPPKE